MEKSANWKERMNYKGYSATVKYSDEDHLFIGKVNGIQDSVNFHGASVKELEKMFHQAVDNYLNLQSRIAKEMQAKEF